MVSSLFRGARLLNGFYLTAVGAAHYNKKVIDSKDGGAEGSRTPDLLIANETLYQLSYGPIILNMNDLRLC